MKGGSHDAVPGKQSGNMVFVKTVFWFGNRRKKKTGETEKKSGIMLKDNCSKKVDIAAKYPLQGSCAMVLGFFFSPVHKTCTVLEPPEPRYTQDSRGTW